MIEVLYPAEVSRQPPEGRPNPRGRLLEPSLTEKLRDFLPGRISYGPEAQKGQALGGRHYRQGAGFQVQNRLRQAGQGVCLTSFMDDEGGADQVTAEGIEPRLLEGATQERQGPGRPRMGAGLKFPGVGVVAPEAFSQNQVPHCQPRGQGASEPQ
jgi:hypothetical protein